MKLLWEYEYEAHKAQERVLNQFGEPEVMTFGEVMDFGFNLVRVWDKEGNLLCEGFRYSEDEKYATEEGRDSKYSISWEGYTYGKEISPDQKVSVGIDNLEYADYAPFHLEANIILAEE